MQYGDHNPPHFHAYYGGKRGSILIENAEIYEGDLPTAAQRLIREWTSLHQEELIKNWKLIENGEPLLSIEPLE